MWGLAFVLVVTLGQEDAQGPRLFTDETTSRYLDRANELLQGKQWERASELLHRVLQADPALFPETRPEMLHAAVHSEDGKLFLPVRALFLKALASMPQEGLEVYRLAHDREAEERYRAADAAGSLESRVSALSQFLDLFLITSFGDDALERMGDLLLDLGREAEALDCYRRLVDEYPSGGDRPIPVALAKAAYAAARLGDAGRCELYLERLRNEFADVAIEVEGHPVAAKALGSHPRFRVREAEAADALADWPLPGGNAARNGLLADLPAEGFPEKPLWSYRLEQRDPRLIGLEDGWIVSRHDREPSDKPTTSGNADLVRAFPALLPAVVDGVVFYKDYAELVDRRLGSGTLLRGVLGRLTKEPRNPAFRYPLELVRPRPRDPARAAGYEEIYRHFDYGGNGVAVDGNHILVVTQRHAPSQFGEVQEVANHLVCYERNPRGIVLKWAWGDMDGLLYPRSIAVDPKARAAWRDDYESHRSAVILGPGVVSGGFVYTLAQEGGRSAGTSLWAFRIEDGRVAFRTLLHGADPAEHYHLPAGATVAAAGGLVYATTGAGVVAAVEAHPPGRVRWIRRYERSLSARAGGRRGNQRQVVEQAFALSDPIVAGGTLVAAPVDAAALLAFAAESGELLWSVPRGQLPGGACLVGVTQGAAILAGRSAHAIDLRTGRPLSARPAALPGSPEGRGFVSPGAAYLPVKSAGGCFVVRFDPRAGEITAQLPVGAPRLGNILSVGGGLLVANAEEISFHSSVARELARRADAADARAIEERARILLLGERRADARAEFRRAIEAAAREGSDDAPIRRAAIDNLFAIARDGGDLSAIEEARAIAPNALYRAQATLVESEVHALAGKPAEAFQALDRLANESAGTAVVLGNAVLPAEQAAAAQRRLFLRARPEFQEEFARATRARIAESFGRKDEAELARIPALVGIPPAEEAYLRHADLLLAANREAEAELSLRCLVRDFPESPQVAVAHLRVALSLARRGAYEEARRERDRASARMKDAAEEARALLEKVDAALPRREADSGTPMRIALPLAVSASIPPQGAPVRVEGSSVSMLADPTGWSRLRPDGSVLWRHERPAPLGSADTPETAELAAIADEARFASEFEGDIVLGDLFGLARLDGSTGKPRFERAEAEQARLLSLVRADRMEIRKEGHLLRRGRLPRYAIAGPFLWRASPLSGVEVIDLRSGETVTRDPTATGPLAGPPQVQGSIVVVGWTAPGRARIYQLDGNFLRERTVPVLLAPPRLDAAGRLFLVAGSDEEASDGELLVESVQGSSPLPGSGIKVHFRYAAMLAADPELALFHDGSTRPEGNLHLIDHVSGTVQAIRAPEINREFDTARSGEALFVLTHKRGFHDEGARIYRIDLRSRRCDPYANPKQCDLYSSLLVTQDLLFLAGAQGTNGFVQAFEKEPAPERRKPSTVFQVGNDVFDLLAVKPTGSPRFDLPPALAPFGRTILVSGPAGCRRLAPAQNR